VLSHRVLAYRLIGAPREHALQSKGVDGQEVPQAWP
jgi:hypothetical protein